MKRGGTARRDSSLDVPSPSPLPGLLDNVGLRINRIEVRVAATPIRQAEAMQTAEALGASQAQVVHARHKVDKRGDRPCCVTAES